MLRIGYLVSRYPAISHTFILREVRELRRLGFEIAVASINDPDRPPSGLTEEERAEAAATYYIKSAGLGAALPAALQTLLERPGAFAAALWFSIRLGGMDLKRILYGVLYFAEAVLLGRWMKSRNLHRLHVHFATPAATVAMITAKLFPITFSMTVHGPDEFYDVPGYYLEKKIATASLVCAISDYARSQLIRLAPAAAWGKVEITRLGVDPEVFAARPPKPPGDVFEVLCVGRLVNAKGQQILLEAMVHLRAAGRPVHLRFVGDGPDRAALTARAAALGLAGAVTFEGAVNQDRIRAFYNACDIFALPSFAEGIPVVLMEAMAMEIPCVTTWITGIPELIRNGEDGLLVPPGNERALADAIARLMDDPALRSRLGPAGRARVLAAYNLKPSVERLAEVFRAHFGGGK